MTQRKAMQPARGPQGASGMGRTVAGLPPPTPVYREVERPKRDPFPPSAFPVHQVAFSHRLWYALWTAKQLCPKQ